MSRPRLLLLDEPSLGLAPLMVERIFETIAELKRQGRRSLLVDQNVHHALEVADRAYVLETGRVTLDGPADVLRTDRKVEQSYLGGGGVARGPEPRRERLRNPAGRQRTQRREPIRPDGGRAGDGVRD